jgi:hypothetical protein
MSLTKAKDISFRIPVFGKNVAITVTFEVTVNMSKK